MLCVYCNYKYFYSYSAGIDFRRQNLTSTDVRFWRLKSIPALNGLAHHVQWSPCMAALDGEKQRLVSMATYQSSRIYRVADSGNVIGCRPARLRYVPANTQTFTRCSFNVGPASQTVVQHLSNTGWISSVRYVCDINASLDLISTVFSQKKIFVSKSQFIIRKHEMWTQRWFNAGPTPQMVAQL